MGDRRARIPASEVGDEPRNWNLPFWTEPTHVVETPEDLDGDNDVLMEVAEVETVTPLTADELEAIRQEAYNEGLQQGLEEGREKGEKLGHETGLAQGQKTGHEVGRKEGYDVGKTQGEVEAKGRAELQRNSLQTQLHGFMQALNEAMLSQQEEVETILPSVIENLAKAVVTQELSQGSEHIVHLVKQAIAALPVKLNDFTIEINHNDFPFIETALEQKQFTANLQSNEAVEAGGCLIHSEKSLIDFTLSNRWEEVLKDYHQRLQLKASVDTDQEVTPEGDLHGQALAEASAESDVANNQIPAEPTENSELDGAPVETETVSEPQGLVDIPELIEEEPIEEQATAQESIQEAETESEGLTEKAETRTPDEALSASETAEDESALNEQGAAQEPIQEVETESESLTEKAETPTPEDALSTTEVAEDELVLNEQDTTEELNASAIEETSNTEQEIKNTQSQSDLMDQPAQSADEPDESLAEDAQEQALSASGESVPEASDTQNTSETQPPETQPSSSDAQTVDTETKPIENQGEASKDNEEAP